MPFLSRRVVLPLGLIGAGLGGAPLEAATVTLPPYPYVANPTFGVDEAGISALAEAYCAQAGANADEIDFFYGALALESMDALGLETDTSAEASAWLGNLYISGYFGGIWLRDSLESARALERALPLTAPSSSERLSEGNLEASSEKSTSEEAVIRSLARVVGRQVDAGLYGGRTQVQSLVRASLPAFLELYGYNLGYLEVLLEQPPVGVTPSVDMVCPTFLSCRSDLFELQSLEAFAGADEAVSYPDSLRWSRMVPLVEAGEAAKADGRAVWEDILSESAISATAYDPLLRVSVGYLLVAEATVLAGLTGWAEPDLDASRATLMLEAGLTMWSGAYFMGLASSAPAGEWPTLSCGG